MKKLKFSIRVIIITIALLLLSELPIFATTGKSTVSSLRIRKTPSTDGEVIDVLAVGDPVEILSEQGDWYNVSAKGSNGYVSKEFIAVNGNNVQQENNTQEQENQQENEQNNTQNHNNNNESENQQENDNKVQETAQVTNKIYKIAEDTQVNILPILTSELIGELKKGTEVNLINNAGIWVYIQSQNIYGWVKIDKLSNEEIVSTNINIAHDNNNVSNEPESYTPKTMYVKGTAVNVRAQSNTSSDIVCSIMLNEQVKVVGKENNWYKIEYSGKSGYVRNDLLSDSKTEVTSRSNNIDRNVNKTEQQTIPEQKNVDVSMESERSNEQQESITVNKENEQQNVIITSENNEQQVVNNEINIEQNVSQVQPSVPVSDSGVSGNDIVEYAKKFLGCRYVYGAAGPNSFDCSGLTMYVYQHFGYSLSHSSKIQATQGKAVTGELQPGDILVFTNNGSTVGHVGIYIGNDKFIHASDSSTGVIISNLSDSWNKSKYMGARRIL